MRVDDHRAAPTTLATRGGSVTGLLAAVPAEPLEGLFEDAYRAASEQEVVAYNPADQFLPDTATPGRLTTADLPEGTTAPLRRKWREERRHGLGDGFFGVIADDLGVRNIEPHNSGWIQRSVYSTEDNAYDPVEFPGRALELELLLDATETLLGGLAAKSPDERASHVDTLEQTAETSAAEETVAEMFADLLPPADDDRWAAKTAAALRDVRAAAMHLSHAEAYDHHSSDEIGLGTLVTVVTDGGPITVSLDRLYPVSIPGLPRDWVLRGGPVTEAAPDSRFDEGDCVAVGARAVAGVRNGDVDIEELKQSGTARQMALLRHFAEDVGTDPSNHVGWLVDCLTHGAQRVRVQAADLLRQVAAGGGGGVLFPHADRLVVLAGRDEIGEQLLAPIRAIAEHRPRALASSAGAVVELAGRWENEHAFESVATLADRRPDSVAPHTRRIVDYVANGNGTEPCGEALGLIASHDPEAVRPHISTIVDGLDGLNAPVAGRALAAISQASPAVLVDYADAIFERDHDLLSTRQEIARTAAEFAAFHPDVAARHTEVFGRYLSAPDETVSGYAARALSNIVVEDDRAVGEYAETATDLFNTRGTTNYARLICALALSHPETVADVDVGLLASVVDSHADATFPYNTPFIADSDAVARWLDDPDPAVRRVTAVASRGLVGYDDRPDVSELVHGLVRVAINNPEIATQPLYVATHGVDDGASLDGVSADAVFDRVGDPGYRKAALANLLYIGFKLACEDSSVAAPHLDTVAGVLRQTDWDTAVTNALGIIALATHHRPEAVTGAVDYIANLLTEDGPSKNFAAQALLAIAAEKPEAIPDVDSGLVSDSLDPDGVRILDEERIERGLAVLA